MRCRNQKASIWQLEIQQRQSDGVDVRSVRINCHTAQCTLQAGELFPKGYRRSVAGQRWFVQGGGTSNSGLTGSCSVHLSRPLIGAKEKKFALVNRSSERKSELVLFEVWPPLASAVQEVIVGIENIVAQKLENRPVVCVGPLLRDHADVGPCAAPA